MGAAQTRNFWKKLSKLFCFWEDNLALAKFQCPIDTPLNYNLLQLKNLNFKIRQIPLQSLFVAVSVITKIIYSVKAYTVIFPVIGICIAVPRGGNSGKVRIFAVRWSFAVGKIAKRYIKRFAVCAERFFIYGRYGGFDFIVIFFNGIFCFAFG